MKKLVESCSKRFTISNLLPLSYWHEYLDMVLLFKLTNNMTYTEKGLLPTVKEPGRSTRSSNRVDGAIMLEEQLCRTSTRAFFNIQAGGDAPQSPLLPPPPPPHEITFCPPRKSPFFLNVYKQTSED